jgi:hypothetical protein
VEEAEYRSLTAQQYHLRILRILRPAQRSSSLLMTDLLSSNLKSRRTVVEDNGGMVSAISNSVLIQVVLVAFEMSAVICSVLGMLFSNS